MKLIEHRRTPAVRAWLKREVSEQNARYQRISRAINEQLAPTRDRWYAEFLERIQARGYSVTYDQLRKITPDELPKKPKRKTRVVY
jgi:uncharacterized protein YPO0396